MKKELTLKDKWEFDSLQIIPEGKTAEKTDPVPEKKNSKFTMRVGDSKIQKRRS